MPLCTGTAVAGSLDGGFLWIGAAGRGTPTGTVSLNGSRGAAAALVTATGSAGNAAGAASPFRASSEPESDPAFFMAGA